MNAGDFLKIKSHFQLHRSSPPESTLLTFPNVTMSWSAYLLAWITVDSDHFDCLDRVVKYSRPLFMLLLIFYSLAKAFAWELSTPYLLFFRKPKSSRTMGRSLFILSFWDANKRGSCGTRRQGRGTLGNRDLRPEGGEWEAGQERPSGLCGLFVENHEKEEANDQREGLGTMLSVWHSHHRTHVQSSWTGISASPEVLALPLYSQHLILFRVLHSAPQFWASLSQALWLYFLYKALVQEQPCEPVLTHETRGEVCWRRGSSGKIRQI